MFRSASSKRTAVIQVLTRIWKSGVIDLTKAPQFHKLCTEILFTYASTQPQQRGKQK